MKTERFEMIMKNLSIRLWRCKRYLGSVLKKSDIDNLTLAQLKELREFSKTEQAAMNKIVQGELYHILGADLTVVQQSKFISLLCEYMTYRSDIKRMDTWLSGDTVNIDKLPNIPVQSEYQLTVLGDFKLVYNLREGVEQEDTFTVTTNEPQSLVEQATPQVTNNKVLSKEKLLFTYNGNKQITIEEDHLREALAQLVKLIPAFRQFSVDKFYKKAIAEERHGGIQFNHIGNRYYGSILTNSVKSHIHTALHKLS